MNFVTGVVGSQQMFHIIPEFLIFLLDLASGRTINFTPALRRFRVRCGVGVEPNRPMVANDALGVGKRPEIVSVPYRILRLLRRDRYGKGK